MTITSGFFRSVGGDRKYTAEFFTSYFASFIANGVFPNPSDNLQILQFQNMQTIVRPGKAWINGNYMINDADFIIQHTISNGIFPRIDRIVVGLNFDTRAITLYLKTGTPSASPVAPALTRNATLYELALADVLIPQGSTQISQSNITDTRLNTQLCGIVHGLVEQVDTTTLYNQYLQAFNNFTDARQAEFDAFFEDLQDTLSGDVAGNLLTRIQNIEAIRELDTFNLINGTKDWTKNFIRLTNVWTFSNDSDSYPGLTTIQRTGTFQGAYKNILLEVGNYTLAAYVRTTGGSGVALNVDAINVTPAAVTNINTMNFNNTTSWTLVNMPFTVTQRGYVSPRVQDRLGGGTTFVAGLNLYKGHYKREWFPSLEDINTYAFESTLMPAGLNLNQITTPGRYFFQQSNVPSNLPPGITSGGIYLEVENSRFNVPYQRVIHPASGKEYFRAKRNNSESDASWEPFTITNYAISTQQQALNGTDDSTIMTPLKVKNVTDTKLNLTGGNLTGNLTIQKGIPEIILSTPNGNYNFSIRKNSNNDVDLGTDFYSNNQIAFTVISPTNVRFQHNTLGQFTVQDAFDKLQAQATIPTTPIPNGKFIGVYE